MSLIEKLTPEQEALIPVYREKWRAIALSTEPINRQKATEAVKTAYAAIGKQEPAIVFVDSPFSALRHVASLFPEQLKDEPCNELDSAIFSKCIELRDRSAYEFWNELERRLWALHWKDPMTTQTAKVSWRSELWNQLNQRLDSQLSEQLESLLVEQLERQLWQQLDEHLVLGLVTYVATQLIDLFQHQQKSDPEFEIQYSRLEDAVERMLSGLLHNHYFHGAWRLWIFNSWNSRAAFTDFCFSVLKFPCEGEKWLLFQSLVECCNWMFPLENLCLVCDRPCILSFDTQQRLHAEGSPGIQFADGFSVYAYHGIRLPEKYGKLHPTHWQAEWLLLEENAELRRVLIQGIGYARICQELQAIELDSWQKYMLLKIESNVDIEPIYLLKMTCPSTGYIHAMRVPPDIHSAREAITWVNWGISPDKFYVQT